jgi:hypothetical protein
MMNLLSNDGGDLMFRDPERFSAEAAAFAGRMSRLAAVCVLFSAIILCGCSRKFRAESISFGSDITRTGLISKDLSVYTFSYEKSGKMKDLCNYIYFEGDTLCFSADFSKDIDGGAAAWFVDPSNGKRVMAERVEVLRSRVYGFSLVGSMCEFFLKESLDAPVLPAKNRTITRPFLVIVEATSGGKKSVIEGKGVLTVHY